MAFYAEKGYYLRVISLLLIGKRVTTYTQKGYYIREKHLLVSGFMPVYTHFKEYSDLLKM